MKISQVEELVGITKKNIRFYEDEGLLSPERDPENGYREYSLKDVDELMKIKFLRKLSVPLEDIRKVQKKELSLSMCLEKQSSNLKSEITSLESSIELCDSVKDKNLDYSDFKADDYLEEMHRIEERGGKFMNVSQTDVKKKKLGALLAAAVFLAIMVAYIIFFLMVSVSGETPMPLFIVIMFVGIAVIVGCILALKQRLKEIEGGEEDEASKY